MEEQKQYFVACAVITNDNGEILLTQRYNPGNEEVHGKWQLPGGSVDLGEHPKESAIREVKEETGLSVEITSSQPYIFSHVFSTGVHIVLIVYKAKYISGILDISQDLEETSDAKWFRPEVIKELNTLPETSEIIQTIVS